MSSIAAIAQALGDRANPVVIKELRQAVQSRLVVAILMLFLLANVMIVCGFVILSNDVTANERAGLELFSILFGVLVFTSMIFVPLYAAARLTMERNDSNIDLLFITTIAPAAIIRGKFFAAVALTVLIYSACLPFLTLTYLLRGIDLPSIFFALGTAFLVTTLMNMIAIFAGSISGGMLLRFLLGGGLVFVGGWMMIYTIAGALVTIYSGMGRWFEEPEAWATLGLSVLSGACTCGLFYLLAVAAVSARSSNRMFPVRVFIAVCWAGFGVALAIWAWVDKSATPIIGWVIVGMIVLCTAMAFTLAERESWSPRMRRHIPRNPVGRFIAWLLYTGSAGGMAWYFVLCTVTLALGSWTASLDSSRLTINRDTIDVMLGVFLYTWCYSMTGLLVRRIVAPNSAPIVGTAIGLMLLVLGCALPLFLAYLMLGPVWQFQTLPIWLVLFDPFSLERTASDQDVVLGFLMIWSLLVLLFNLRWFHRQWQAFCRYEPKPVIIAELSTPDAPVVHA